MQKILTIFANFIFILSLLFSGFLLLSKATNLPLPKVFLVSSGSMEPAIKTGSLVFTLPQKNYSVGDVVTFKSDAKSKTTTTHRIVGIGGGVIRTAGDANNSPDNKLISVSAIVGKVYSIIPYLGYLAGFIQTPQGFILFVIVPATILVYEELKSVFSMLPKRQVNVKPVFFIIPFLFAGLVLTTKSNSYFSDVETSSANSFTAWIPTATPVPPTPTPTPIPADHLVFSEIQIKGTSAGQDFVEIYNPTSSAQDLSNWKLRYCPTNGVEISLAVIPTGKAIPAHGFFLWASNDVSGFDTSIGADIANGNNLSENYGVALRKADDTLVDQVGWGNSTCTLFEGTRYPDINSKVKSIERKAYWNSTEANMVAGGDHATNGNGYDGGDNATDFISRSTGSNPQNSLSPTETP